MAKLKIKAMLTKEERAPSQTIVCNLKEQEAGLPWVFKCGSESLEDHCKEWNKKFHKREEWFRPMCEFVISKMNYSSISEKPFGYDTIGFHEALEIIVEAIRDEYMVAKGRPNQKMIGEED